MRTLEVHDYVSTITIYDNGAFAISGSGSLAGTLKIWDLETGQCLLTMAGHTHIVSTVAVCGNGNFAISGSHDNTLKLWNLENGQCVGTLNQHTSAIVTVGVYGDGNFAVSCDDSGVVIHWRLIWDLEFDAGEQFGIDTERNLENDFGQYHEAFELTQQLFLKGDFHEARLVIQNLPYDSEIANHKCEWLSYINDMQQLEDDYLTPTQPIKKLGLEEAKHWYDNNWENFRSNPYVYAGLTSLYSLAFLSPGFIQVSAVRALLFFVGALIVLLLVKRGLEYVFIASVVCLVVQYATNIVELPAFLDNLFVFVGLAIYYLWVFIWTSLTECVLFRLVQGRYFWMRLYGFFTFLSLAVSFILFKLLSYVLGSAGAS